MSAHPAEPSPARPTLGGAEMRVSDTDRDAAADVLNAAFAEGRLTVDEHAQRVEAAYAARTWQQLHQLTPVGGPAEAGEPHQRGPGRCC